DARLAFDPCHHLGRVRQLRYPFRADEAGGLDAAQAGGREPVHQRDLVRGGDHRRLVLQAAARGDLDDADEVAHAASAASPTTTSTASASTKSPATARSAATVPARGALTDSSIFIASITSSSAPASTCWPASTRTTTTRPGIGARTWPSPAVSSPPARSLAM